MRRAVLLAALCAAAAFPAAARAGTYTTVSCADPDTHQPTGRSGFPPGWSFAEYQPGSGNWYTFDACGRWGGGFGFQTTQVGGRVPYPQWGQVLFNPPADTAVAGVRVARALRRPYPIPFVVPMLAFSPVDWCHAYWSGCDVGSFESPSDPTNLAEFGAAPSYELLCDGSSGCPRDGQATWVIFGARITLSDDYPPSFAAAPAGLPDTPVVAGTHTVSVGGVDRGGGLLRAELLAGAQVIGSASFDSNGRCDSSFHTDLVPCPLSAGRSLSADTTKVADGDYAIVARLTDVAGNTTTYALGTRTIDNHPDPGAPVMESRSAWLNAQQASVYGVALGAPATRVAGYAVSIDGSEPGTTVDVAADLHGDAVYGPPPGGWPEGRVVVKARSIAAGGEPSSQVAQALIRVDSRAPELTVAGAGTAGDWRPAPVVLTLGARDSGSGMGAADDGQPVESGGYIAYALDGQPSREVAGDEATVAASGLGNHTLTFRAYDAAGNVSADRTISFLVGRPQPALSDPNFGFWDRSANPGTSFTAAASFADACPDEVILTPARDTYVDEAQPDSAFGSASALVVRSAAGTNARALLAFDLPAADGCGVTRAALRVHASSAAAGRTIRAFRAGGSWDAETTWATRPGAVGDPATATAAAGWVSFDVTQQVRGIYAHGDDGLLLRDASEGAATPAGQAYGSSEGAGAERPELVVRYG